MTRKKILFIIPWLPYPLISGGHHGLMNAMIALKDEFDIHIAFKVYDAEKYEENKKGFIELVPHAHLYPLLREDRIEVQKPEFPFWYRLASHLKAYIQNCIKKRNSGNIKNIDDVKEENAMPSSWIYSVSPLDKFWLDHISKICVEHHFDIIQVEMPWLISQVLTLPKETKKIFVHHELGFVRRSLEIEPYINNEYVKACKSFADMAEIGLLNMYDGVITVSPIDREKLIEKGVTVPVFSSFSIVNQPKDIERRTIDAKHLSFIGPDSHTPNFMGITWFLDNCWPLLKSKDREYKLSIIGGWSQEHIDEYTNKYPNVEFLGYVDNLGDAIKGTIMIVPITIGSGIRMKILEASSLGVPFVSTSVGAEGLPVENGKNCFIADDKEMFVNCILKLQDTTIQEKFIENAHTMILEKFSIKALRENRLDIYKQVLNN